jgi:hypothetical protein
MLPKSGRVLQSLSLYPFIQISRRKFSFFGYLSPGYSAYNYIEIGLNVECGGAVVEALLYKPESDIEIFH